MRPTLLLPPFHGKTPINKRYLNQLVGSSDDDDVSEATTLAQTAKHEAEVAEQVGGYHGTHLAPSLRVTAFCLIRVISLLSSPFVLHLCSARQRRWCPIFGISSRGPFSAFSGYDRLHINFSHTHTHAHTLKRT